MGSAEPSAEKGRELEDAPKGRGGRATVCKAHRTGREEGEEKTSDMLVKFRCPA